MRCRAGSGKSAPFPSLIPFPLSLNPFLFLPPFLFPLCPFPAPRVHIPSLNPVRESGERCELPRRFRAKPGRQGVSGTFGAENQAARDSTISEDFTTMRCDPCWPATYPYGISQRRSDGMVSSRSEKCRHAIPSHTVLLPILMWCR